MGHRISKVYTRTGDDGTTGLSDTSRVKKNHPRIVAMGYIDELNCCLGILLTEENIPKQIANALTTIQHQLFDLGAELSIPGAEKINQQQVTDIENLLDNLNSKLPPLKEFILPGGSKPSALCHCARAVCRRAESSMVALLDSEPLNPISLRYINRLSDLLFVFCRILNLEKDVAEVYWKNQC